jgi:DNA-binding response OmpR family regulator
VNEPLALIVEDDYDISKIFEEALKAAGFKTQVMRNGRAALEQLNQDTPNVVVLDLHLPEVAGTDILKHINADARLAQTHVIVITADARLAESLESEAFLVLVKPVDFSQLRDLALRLRQVSQ